MVCFVVLWITGCDRFSKKSATATDRTIEVHAGIGVTNVCEVGMPLSRVRRAAPKVSTHGLYDGKWDLRRFTASRYILVPALSAIGTLHEGKVGVLTFYVRPNLRENIPGLIVRDSFRGNIAGGPSFEDAPVTKAQIEASFGAVQRGFTNSFDGTTSLNVREPFFRKNGDRETLHYYRQGISFDLEKDVVVSFTISKPIADGEPATVTVRGMPLR